MHYFLTGRLLEKSRIYIYLYYIFHLAHMVLSPQVLNAKVMIENTAENN
jgi:hypothetical protein